MQFNAQQLREEALIPKGEYRFRVLQGREKKSVNGNDMMILKLMLTVNGRDCKFWCTLILIPKMFWLVEHFCNATGMREKIEEGNLMAQDCDGKSGILLIDHRINKETGAIEEYVKDFIVSSSSDSSDEKNEDDFFNDSIPNLV